MRHFDLSPLYRSTVGFDRLFSMLDQVGPAETNSYPPYNIERLSENEYRISIAVAGFTADELDIEIKDRFGNPVVPREWFLTPLFAVDEAVERIKDGTITSYIYDPAMARLRKR